MSGRFWPIAEPAQADYEQLREIVLAGGELGELLAARRFARRGLAGLISWPVGRARVSGLGDRRAPPGVVWVVRIHASGQLRDTYAFLLDICDPTVSGCGWWASEGRALRARVDRAPAGAWHDRLAARGVARGGQRRRR